MAWGCIGSPKELFAQHHAETRLCIAVRFNFSFVTNIARKRPELKRGETSNLAALQSVAQRGYANSGLVTAASTVGAPMARSGRSGAASRPITINAPITVEGRAGTPEQKRDLAKQISKSIEQSMRQTVVTELQRQLRPCNMLNSGKR
jgi:hypothetical protein